MQRKCTLELYANVIHHYNLVVVVLCRYCQKRSGKGCKVACCIVMEQL